MAYEAASALTTRRRQPPKLRVWGVITARHVGAKRVRVNVGLWRDPLAWQPSEPGKLSRAVDLHSLAEQGHEPSSRAASRSAVARSITSKDRLVRS